MNAKHRTIADGRTRKWVKLLIVLASAGYALLGLTARAVAASWDETVAAARQEGELVAVLGGAASRNYRPIFRLFEEKFGVRTVVSTGGGGKQADRVLAERAAGKYEVDIIMVGGTTGNTRLVANGVADPMSPVLFHPEVVNQSLWLRGKHLYSDPEEKYIFAFSGTADLAPVAMRFNTTKWPVDEVKTLESVWTFLDRQRFKSEIVALPPTVGGAGGSYFMVQVHPDLGENYLRRLFDPQLDVTFLQDYRQVADGVAQGKYTMAIFVGSAGRDIDRLGKQGLPVANVADVLERPLKERPTLQGTGASNNIMVVNRRPHPNAANLFVNWFLSKEGQTVMHTRSERIPDQTFRVDVTETGKVNEAEMRKPGVEYLTIAHDPEAQKKRLGALKRAEELFQEIRGR